MPSVTLARHLMGTRFEVVLPGAEDTASAARLRAAGEEALDEIERLDRQLSMYRADSDVSVLNACAAGGWVPVEPRLFRLIRRMKDLWEETVGAFDPAVGPLLRAWGFHGGSGRWPEEYEVEVARRITGMGHVDLDEAQRAVRYDVPGVSLDVGAIGKGYAVEAAMEILQELGVTAALLHGGTSTVAALGAPEGLPAWNIAIADPVNPEHTLAVLPLSEGRSLSVSGVHGKAFTGPDGREYGHVLDPRSGRPVAGARLAAVVTASATDADALSTALLVLAADGLETIAQRWPDASALLLLNDGTLIRSGSLFAPAGAPDGGP